MSTLLSSHRSANRAGGLIALLVLIGALAIPGGPAWAQRVAGQATAAAVTTTAAGSQTFAGAMLPQGGGMDQSDVDNAIVDTTFGATGLTSITTGQLDGALVSVTTSAEAADVNILNVSYADGVPASNTRVELPGVGYVVLNEQISSGDGVRSTGLTVNMIHVYLVDPLTGAPGGEIVVAAATSTASL